MVMMATGSSIRIVIASNGTYRMLISRRTTAILAAASLLIAIAFTGTLIFFLRSRSRERIYDLPILESTYRQKVMMGPPALLGSRVTVDRLARFGDTPPLELSLHSMKSGCGFFASAFSVSDGTTYLVLLCPSCYEDMDDMFMIHISIGRGVTEWSLRDVQVSFDTCLAGRI